jgi:hypothetical protein
MPLLVTHERCRIVDHFDQELTDVFRNNPGFRGPSVITPVMKWTGRKEKYSPTVMFNYE